MESAEPGLPGTSPLRRGKVTCISFSGMRLLDSNGHRVPTAQSFGMMSQLWLLLCPCDVHSWGTQASAIPVAAACWLLHKRLCRGQKKLDILMDPSGWPRLPLPLYPLAWIEAPVLSMGDPR